MPKRIITILEGESLVNDATALVAYKFAIGAVGAAGVTVWTGGLKFLAIGAGGIAIGLVAGWLFGRLRRAFDEPSIDVTLSLLTPFRGLRVGGAVSGPRACSPRWWPGCSSATACSGSRGRRAACARARSGRR